MLLRSRYFLVLLFIFSLKPIFACEPNHSEHDDESPLIINACPTCGHDANTDNPPQVRWYTSTTCQRAVAVVTISGVIIGAVVYGSYFLDSLWGEVEPHATQVEDLCGKCLKAEDAIGDRLAQMLNICQSAVHDLNVIENGFGTLEGLLNDTIDICRDGFNMCKVAYKVCTKY